jgi:hypothetical protein
VSLFAVPNSLIFRHIPRMEARLTISGIRMPPIAQGIRKSEHINKNMKTDRGTTIAVYIYQFSSSRTYIIAYWAAPRIVPAGTIISASVA